MSDLVCPKCHTVLEMKPPTQVWISWCDGCGNPDYAYKVKPEKAGADCPRCGTPREEMKITGPYALVEVTVAR